MVDLEALVEQVVSGMGFELVDFEVSPRARILRVFIDIERGVTVDDCATVSDQLQRVFEVEDIDYDRLEVSSPGLDRVLKKPRDFARFVGSRVQLKLREPWQGRKNLKAELLGIEADRVRVASELGEHEFALAEIDRARLVPQFDGFGGKKQ